MESHQTNKNKIRHSKFFLRSVVDDLTKVWGDYLPLRVKLFDVRKSCDLPVLGYTKISK